MNALSAAAIVDLPLNAKEEEHPGRNRKGYHIYLSRFFMDYKQLSLSDKEEFLALNANIISDGGENNDEDDSDANSLDTPPRPNLI